MSGAIAMGTSKITGLGNGSAAQDAAAFGQIAAAASQGLLARVQYAPASNSSYSTTSGTLAAIDTTHLTIPFTVPASGAVLVRLTGVAYTITTGASGGFWALLDHTSHAQVGYTIGMQYTLANSSPGNMINTTAAFLITSLTPAASLQYDWAFATSAATFYLNAAGLTGTGSSLGVAPATMEVWAA